MTPVSEFYGSISGYVIFWVLFAIAFGFFLQRITFLVRLLHRGQLENCSDSFGRRLKDMFLEVFTQWCNLKTIARGDLSGIGHALMFWGFSLFLLSYVIFIGFAGGFGISALSGSTFEIVYSSILDIAAVLVMAAIVWAAIRRYIVKPERLEVSLEAGVILMLVTLLMLLHFSIEGFGYAAHGIPGSLPPIGVALASLLTNISQEALEVGYKVSWWLHYAVILGFMIYIPYSKHLHILVSPFNVLFRSVAPKGTLRLIEPEKTKTIGAAKIEDFTWKSLLDLYSCAVCGRCHANCPATMSGKPLDPREVILNLKEHLLEVGGELLKGKTSHRKSMIKDVVTEEEIWDCTTCYACQEVCPVSIEQMAKIVEMRRGLVEQGRVSPAVAAALESMRLLGNPWEKPQSSRLDWAEGRKVSLIQEKGEADVLYWVGCASAYDPRSRSISLAMLSLLDKAGVNYALLGTEEKCCGDTARRMGEEGLFQKLALANIETLRKYRFKKILTQCPHGYNTLKNEYPQLGGKFEVMHHSQFILELIRSGKLKLQGGQELKLTFHDPCYLGRYNGMYDPSRQILQSIPRATLAEMRLNRSKAMCCGAGGGQVWIQSAGGRRIEDMRFEQVQEVGADVVATACPYCAIMLDAVAQTKEPTGKIKVLDIAELVNKALS
jgi:Fe-S oxidoreductase